MSKLLLNGFISIAVVTIPLFAQPTRAQGFPNQPVRIIVPFGAGGGTDILIRALAPAVSASLGQNILVENRPGAGSVIGSEMAAKAAPDGYTLLASDTSILVNPGLRKNMPFDTLKDLRTVGMLAVAPVLLVAHPSVAARNLTELLALARAKPGSLNYASGGNGASTHLSGELMKIAAGVNITHIPYKGTGPAMNDLLGGQVHMQFAGISAARQFVEAGRLKAMAVTGASRNPAMPEVPTFTEMGVAGVDADTYWGLYAPAGVANEIAQKLNQHFATALRAPDMAERLAKLGFIPIANSPQEHAAQMRTMIARWTDVVTRANIQAD